MAFDKTYSEDTPATGDKVNKGDDEIRNLKYAQRERDAVDHNRFADESGETNIGAHKKVTLVELATKPTAATDVGFVYTKNDSGDTELYYEDAGGNEIKLTTDGYINGDAIASGVFATLALDNLASVAINTSLLSDTTNTDDLGSAAKLWKSIYLGTSLFAGTTELTIAELSYLNGASSNLQTQITALPGGWTDVDGWFSSIVGTTYTKAHGISMTFPADVLEIKAFWRASSSGSYGVQVPVGLSTQDGSGTAIGYNGTNLFIEGSVTRFGNYTNSSGTNVACGNGELRVFVRKLT